MSGEDQGVVQVVMGDAVFKHLKAWLRARGLEAVASQYDPEDIPTYTVGFRASA